MSDPTVRRRRLRILVVDDDKDIRGFFTQLLRSEGYGVTEAENGGKGMERFREGEYDLVSTVGTAVYGR